MRMTNCYTRNTYENAAGDPTGSRLMRFPQVDGAPVSPRSEGRRSERGRLANDSIHFSVGCDPVWMKKHP
jgi:hypothetical protein